MFETGTMQRAYDEVRYLDAYAMLPAALRLELPSEPAARRVALRQIAAELDDAQLLLLGRLAVRLGGGTDARWLAACAFARNPDDPEVEYHLGRHRKPPRSLLQNLERAEQLHALPQPDGLRAHREAEHALMLTVVRDFAGADARMARARGLGGDAWWLDVCEAHIATRRDEIARAAALAESAFAARPTHPAVMDAIADAATAQGRPMDALPRLVAALEAGQPCASTVETVVHLALTVGERDPAPLLDAGAAGCGVPALLERARGLPALAPWADVHTRKHHAMLRSRMALCAGETAEAAEAARKVEHGYYEKMAAKLEAGGAAEGRRVVLPHPLVRQDHSTCLPASVVTCAGMLGVAIDHDALVREMTADGTPTWRARDWALGAGLRARAFVIDAEAARALLDAGLPFLHIARWLWSAHATAVVGYDSRIGTLCIHDPSLAALSEVTFEGLDLGQAPVGPIGLVVAPADRAAALDAIPLRGCAFAEAEIAYDKAQHHGDLSAAEEIVAALATAEPEAATTRVLQARLAVWQGKAGQGLELLRGLLQEFPRCEPLQADLLWTTERTGHRALFHQTLRSIVRRRALPGVDGSREWITPQPEAMAIYAQILVDSAGEHVAAERLIRRCLLRAPSLPTTYAALTRLRLRQGRRADALLPARLAAIAEDAHAGRAETYAHTLRQLGEPEQAIASLRDRAERLRERANGAGAALTIVRFLREIGRPEQADAVFAQAERDFPTAQEIVVEQVLALGRSGAFAQAHARLEALRTAIGPGDAHLVAHHLHSRAGDWSAALAEATAWHRDEPTNGAARQALIAATMATRGLTAVCDLVDGWRAAAPDDGAIEQLWLETLSDRGDEPARLAALQARIDNDPLDDWAVRERVYAEIAEATRWTPAEREHLLPGLQARIEAAVAMAPHLSASAGMRVELAILLRDDHEALRQIEATLRAEPEHGWALERLFQVVLRLPAAERGVAVEILDRVFAGAIGERGLLPAAAARVAGTVGVEAAREAVLRWAGDDPDDPDAVEARADLELSGGRDAEAAAAVLPALEACCTRFPSRVGLALSRAHALRLLDREAEAIAVYEGLLVAEPTAADAIVNLLFLRARGGDGEALLATCAAAAARLPTTPRVLLAVCRHRWDAGAIDAALDEAEAACRRTPQHDELWEWWIDRLAMANRWDAARQAAQAWCSARPREAAPWMALGDVLERMPSGKTRAELFDAVEQALAREPRLWAATELRARLLWDGGEPNEALAAVQAWLEPDPQHVDGRLLAIRLQTALAEPGGDDPIAPLCELFAAHPESDAVADILLDAFWRRDREPTLVPQIDALRLDRLADPPAAECSRLTLLEQHGVEPADLLARVDALVERYPASRAVRLERIDRRIEAEQLDLAEADLDLLRPLAGERFEVRTREIMLAGARLQASAETEPDDARDRRLRAMLDHAEAMLRQSTQTQRWCSDQAILSLETQNAIPVFLERVRAVLRGGDAICLPLFYALLGRLTDDDEREPLSRLLAAFSPHARETAQREALVGTLSSIAETSHSALVRDWGEKFEAIARSDTRLWQAVARAYAVIDDAEGAVRWFADWRDHPDAEQWALNNLVASLLDLHNYAEAVEVGLHGLEHALADSNRHYLAENTLRAMLCLGQIDAFYAHYQRHAAVLQAQPVDGRTEHALQIEAMGALCEKEDVLAIVIADARHRPRVGPTSWAIHPWRTLLRRKLPWWGWPILLFGRLLTLFD